MFRWAAVRAGLSSGVGDRTRGVAPEGSQGCIGCRALGELGPWSGLPRAACIGLQCVVLGVSRIRLHGRRRSRVRKGAVLCCRAACDAWRRPGSNTNSACSVNNQEAGPGTRLYRRYTHDTALHTRTCLMRWGHDRRVDCKRRVCERSVSRINISVHTHTHGLECLCACSVTVRLSCKPVVSSLIPPLPSCFCPYIHILRSEILRLSAFLNKNKRIPNVK